MSRDLYAAYAGATAAWRALEVVSGNVANASTSGFRAQQVRFENELGAVRATAGGWSDEDGALEADGVDTHLALRGEGWFTLEDGTFTRDGGFQLRDGRLVTRDGTAVLGDGGAVTLDGDELLTVAADGTLSGSRSGELGRLRITRLDDATPLGGGRWTGRAAGEADARVVQGAREGANVDPMRCMVELVEASRTFEAQQKVMQASDEARARLNRIQG